MRAVKDSPAAPLAGWGKTMLARENFDGPHMGYNGRTPLPRTLKKAILFVCRS